MKKIIAIILLVVLSFTVFGQGMTTKIPKGKLVPIGFSDVYKQPSAPKIVSHKMPASFITTLDSLHIQAILGPGEWIAIFVDADAGTLGYVEPEMPVDPILRPYIESAPGWIKPQLIRNLSALDPVYASTYADILASTDPLWLDEMYYCLAHLAHQILETPEMYYLLPENIQYIYSRDSVLSYVEIVDLGTPGGSDHRTVARYATTDTGMAGAVHTVELEPEMYYQYVMFPKITDEIPRYIDPITGDIVDPWSGYFWRTWYWDVAETVFASGESLRCWALGEALEGEDVLWNGLHNSDVGNGAVGVVTKWIKDCFVFNSDAERPHQPVRIYEKHMGRCGEHADITTAACRTGLIPSRNIEAISSDHTWDEFYTGWRWAQLEPVNTQVDDQWAYSDGWGKQFATVSEYSGKGEMIPLTDRYSHEIANVTLNVTDAMDRPIDGAVILIGDGQIIEDTLRIFYDCILTTNGRGQAFDKVGDGKHLFWRVDSEIGCDPEPGYVSNLVTLTADGGSYNRTKALLSSEMPHLEWSEAPPVADIRGWLGARVRPVGEFIQYDGIFDDITATYFKWNGGDAYGFQMFIIDSAEFDMFEAEDAFTAMAMLERIDYGAFETPVSTGSYWVVLSNKENLKNTLVADLFVALHDSSTNVAEGTTPGALSLSVFPNPFNAACEIKIANRKCERIEIFDINGRAIANLMPAKIVGAQSIFKWKPSVTLPTGTYFAKTDFGATRKLLLIR